MASRGSGDGERQLSLGMVQAGSFSMWATPGNSAVVCDLCAEAPGESGCRTAGKPPLYTICGRSGKEEAFCIARYRWLSDGRGLSWRGEERDLRRIHAFKRSRKRRARLEQDGAFVNGGKAPDVCTCLRSTCPSSSARQGGSTQPAAAEGRHDWSGDAEPLSLGKGSGGGAPMGIGRP